MSQECGYDIIGSKLICDQNQIKMGSEKRAMPNASGSKARPMKKIQKSATTNRTWNLSAGMNEYLCHLIIHSTHRNVLAIFIHYPEMNTLYKLAFYLLYRIINCSSGSSHSRFSLYLSRLPIQRAPPPAISSSFPRPQTDLSPPIHWSIRFPYAMGYIQTRCLLRTPP